MFALLEKLYEHGVAVWVEENSLKLAFEDEAPSDELLGEIKQNKAKLLNFLEAKEIYDTDDFYDFVEAESEENEQSSDSDIEAIFAATSLQQGMIYHHVSYPDDDAYQVQFLLDYNQHVDLVAYKEAWRIASLQFPILRTAFDWEGDVIQVVTGSASIDDDTFTEVDLRHLPESEREAEISRLQQEDRKIPFDLHSPGLLRVTLIRQQDDVVTLLMNMHHLITDGWSTPILWQAVHDHYNVIVRGEPPTYEIDSAYLATQQYYASHKQATQAYWGNRCGRFPGANDLSTMLSRRVELEAIKEVVSPASKQITVDGDLYQSLREMCVSLGITLNVATQFAWHKLLQTYSGDSETTVGTTVSGRDVPVPKVESSVGLYINTLPLLVDWSDAALTVKDALLSIQSEIAALNSHSEVSLASLQSEGERLFHSLFVFENYPMPAGDSASNQVGIEYSISFRDSIEKVDYPLAVTVFEENESLIIRLGYSEDWLTQKDAVNLLEQMHKILSDIAVEQDQTCQSLCTVGEEQRQLLLQDFNQTEFDYPIEQTLHGLFETQVLKTPYNTALVCGEETLSYSELNVRANQVAHGIRGSYHAIYGKGLPADTLIALYFDRHVDMIISILAVLKAGGVYVPISPQFPSDRTAYILEDTDASMVLTQSHHNTGLQSICEAAELAPKILVVDCGAISNTMPPDNLLLNAAPSDLAYVIYTSGTTGKPKGVMIEHRNAVHLVQAQGRVFNAAECKSALLFASYVFDASVSEIFIALSYGMSAYLCTEEERNLLQVAKILKNHQVDIATIPPVILKQLVDQEFPELKVLITAGESPSVEFLNVFSRYSNVFNAYGPTEVTVCATAHLYAKGDIVTNIGKPVPNTKLYVLNESQQLVPVGACGELYVSGAGLARGYLNKDAMTAEKFLLNPYATEEEKAQGYTYLYRTGDIVRYLENGDVEYMGRNDNQIKIRGHRVELGEVERALSDIIGVEQAVVSDRKREGRTFLAAYLIMKFDQQIDADLIAHELATALPEYMIPSTYTAIDAMPLTINGKLDYRALPEPELSNEQKYVAPRNELEAELCKIWADVLGLAKIGIEDNFFRCGGDSILAIKLMAAIRHELSIDMSLSLLFTHKTISALAIQLRKQESVVIEHHNLKRYPVSYAQARILFIEKFEGGSDAYHIPNLLELNNSVDLRILQQAIAIVIDRHTVVKSTYQYDDEDNPYLEVIDAGVSLMQAKVSNRAEFVAALKKDIVKPFDLSHEPSLRLYSYTLAADSDATPSRRFLLLLWHHIAMDGWSTDVFVRELTEAYLALSAKRDIQLPELEINYGDYALWQKEFLSEGVGAQQLDFWKDNLSGYENLTLPLDFPRPARVDYRGADHIFTLDASLSEKLRHLARTQETSLYTVMLNAFMLCLARLSGQKDIVVGTPSDNRHHPQTQSLIGMFVNTLVMRQQIDLTASISDAIAATHDVVTNAKANQDVPFEQIVDHLNIERDPSRNAIFQVMFSVQSFGNTIEKELPFTPVSLDEASYSPAKFDLSFFLEDNGESIVGNMNYAKALFLPETIERFVVLYRELLTTYVEKSEECLGELCVVGEQERKRLIHTLNATGLADKQNDTLHGVFEQQARLTPAAIALRFGDTTMTYQALDSRANQLAHTLVAQLAQSTQPSSTHEPIIALYLERGVDMVVSILAVLKAGAAYVPISPSFPEDRTAFILKDTSASVVITQQSLFTGVETLVEAQQMRAKVIDIDAAQCYQSQPTTAPMVTTSSENLAYVIYTSGTTGNPKGVMIEHRTSAGRNQFMAQTGKTTNNVYLFKTNYVFDVSVSDLFSHLSVGATVVIANKILDIDEITHAMESYGVNACHFVPSQFSTLLSTTRLPRPFERVYFSGEGLTKEQLQYINFTSTEVVNYYGPTETGEATFHKPVSVDQGSIIGRPLAGVRVYVMQDKHLAPVGAPGELYISGAGIARGYLNRPDLNEQSFISNPFATEEDKQHGFGRMYKTGDLVRYQTNGDLEYLGRNDSQVKIRGHRIELGEVESALASLSYINQAVVIDRKRDTGSYLSAYYTLHALDDGKEVTTKLLLNALSALLPEYMLPATFTELSEIPLTLNGKLNRRALPEPEWVSTETYVAPTTDLESKLCEVWQNVLQHEHIGIEDNFFRIGGDSITAIKLAAAIRRNLNMDLPLTLLFEQKTIAGIAERLESIQMVTIPHIEQESYPLTFAQQRMLFIESFDKHSRAYHIPSLVKLHEDINVYLFQKAINQICERHPILKTVYIRDDEGQFQQHKVDAELTMKAHLCANEQEMQEMLKLAITRRFNLAEEPSFRIHHYQVNQDAYLLMMWHHVAMDGWSLDIFIDELSEVYHALVNARAPELVPLPITYGDYALWQRDLLAGPDGLKQLDYWQKQLAGYENLVLPTTKKRPERFDYEGAELKISLTPDQSAQLRQLSSDAETTLFTVMLSAFYVTLAKLTGQNDLVVGTPTDSRHHPEIHGLIGVFINSLALRSDVDMTQSAETLIHQVHKVVTKAKLNQDIPFENLVDLLNVERDTSRHPIFQVMFSLQNFGSNLEETKTLPFDGVSLQEGTYTPAKVDLSLFVNDSDTRIECVFNYATSVLKREYISKIAAFYQAVLTAFVEARQDSLGRINIISDQEKSALLYTLNQTDRDYSRFENYVQMLQAQTAKTPQQAALVFGEEVYNYAELDQKSNQMAHFIRGFYQDTFGQELPADTVIALCAERSIEMIVGILSIIKAGAAYVPVSSDLPDERIGFMFEDTQASLVLTQGALQTKLQPIVDCLDNSVSLVAIDNLDCNAYPTTPIDSAISSNQLAYIIYTSGTTGLPKGVAIEHRSLVNYLEWKQGLYELTTEDKVLQKTPYSFDASISELLWAFTTGATLVVAPPAIHRQADELYRCIVQHQITVTHFVPALLDALNQYLSTSGQKLPNSVRLALCGGEVLTQSHVASFHAVTSEHCELHNMYGPTEATVECVTFNARSSEMSIVPVGKPISNAKLYILNEQQELTPYGSVGELYIGGAVLSRGYLNRPELNAERFIANPFATAEDVAKGYDRLYRTGDQVRYLPDGNIEYLGRNDDQVKIRGYRIELGEVTNALVGLSQVKQAVVVDRKDRGQHYLAAYAVLGESETLTQSDMIKALELHIPEYMVPATLTIIDRVPLTLNGKLDRRALPEPERINEDNYVAPRNDFETKLCALWAGVLELPKVGIEDNFFRIGGDSIKAIRLAAQISRTLEREVQVIDLFSAPTIAAFSAQWKVAEQQAMHPLLTRLLSEQAQQHKLFMLPALGSGPEVYVDLANRLGQQFTCFGVNNYNHLYTPIIDSLPAIAKGYREAIMSELSANEPVYLLGWSLGGQIAMEIAYQLEQQGVKNIQVFLLDSMFNGDEVLEFRMKTPLEDIKAVILNQFKKQNTEQSYIDKVLGAFEAENTMSCQHLSGQLQHTKVTLFKACAMDPNLQDDPNAIAIFDIAANLPDNSVCHFTLQPATVIRLDNYWHNNMLEAAELIQRGVEHHKHNFEISVI